MATKIEWQNVSHVFPNGKYKGVDMERVAVENPQYVLWVYINIPQYRVPKMIANKALQNMQEELWELRKKDEQSWASNSEENEWDHVGDGPDFY